MTNAHTAVLPQKPHIKTALPGPKAAEFLKRDHDAISLSYTRSYPLVMEFGEGMMVRDVDGNVFLDFAAGIAVNATGHRHPKVVEAIKKGLDDAFMHMSGTDFYYPEQITLAERLAKLAGGNRRVFFCNSGAEAAECALKLARYNTRRPNVVSMRGAFHGRTLGALSVGNSKSIHRRYFQPLVAGAHHMPFPDPYRGLKPGQTPEELAEECVRYLTDVIFVHEVEPDQVAAILVEPVQGEGGYVVPPANFLPLLRAICDKHGILLAVDEVQAGMGRTGKLFAHQHTGVRPDIIATAKGIASGLPLGAVIANSDLMAWPPGTHASTFGGNPLACRASMATLDLLESELLANATNQGDYLLTQMRQRFATLPGVGDIRGIGLMLAIDFVKDVGTKAPDPTMRNSVVDEAFKRGLLVLGCGKSALRLCPSLTLSQDHCDTALCVLEESIRSAQRGS